MELLTSIELENAFLTQLINRGELDETRVFDSVQNIVLNVKKGGDYQLLQYTNKFDNVTLESSELKVHNKEIQEAYDQLNEIELESISQAADNIERYHKKQVEQEWSFETLEGVVVGRIIRPLSSVGVYAPGGKAAYPSSVLMCAIPAKVAGVDRCIVCSPPQKDKKIAPAILVAADIAGIKDIYKIGGAQAIAALAYGTNTIKPVDKIVGPGNIYVTIAKQIVSRDVAIDLPAGPSELLIISDETANPRFIAADLLAQAEHDPDALTILLTTSSEIVDKVKQEIINQLELLSRKEIAQQSIEKNNYLVFVKHLDDAINYANKIAPEHLEILTRDPKNIIHRIKNAGSIFLGEYSPVAFGDYAAGINHVLPTNGYARISSGLTVSDFIKPISYLECNKSGYSNLKNLGINLARLEKFDGHATSISIREEL